MHPTEERPDAYWGDVHLWRDGERRASARAVEIKYLRLEAFLSVGAIPSDRLYWSRK